MATRSNTLDHVARTARLRLNAKESNRASVRVLRALSTRPLTNTQLWGVLWPGKTPASHSQMMRVTTMTMGRIKNSFMGLLVTGKLLLPPAPVSEMLWTITDEGRDYLDTYDHNPDLIIQCERDARLWLQDAGRRANTPEAIARRIERDNALRAGMDAQAAQDAAQDAAQTTQDGPRHSGVPEYRERGDNAALGTHAAAATLWAVYRDLTRGGRGDGFRVANNGRRTRV